MRDLSVLFLHLPSCIGVVFGLVAGKGVLQLFNGGLVQVRDKTWIFGFSKWMNSQGKDGAYFYYGDIVFCMPTHNATIQDEFPSQFEK